MKNINVLGVQLKDMSVRDAIKLTTLYLNSEHLNTICFANTNLMLEARESDSLKEYIEAMDLVVPVSADIVSATGYREREIRSNLFLREFLKKMSREKRKVFIVGKSEEEQVAIRESLLKIDDRLTFFGCFSYTDSEQPGIEDSMINEINSVLPDVVISLLDSPMHEELVAKEKQKVNARIWLILQKENLMVGDCGEIKKSRIREFFERFLFKRVVNRYDLENNEGNEKV